MRDGASCWHRPWAGAVGGDFLEAEHAGVEVHVLLRSAHREGDVVGTVHVSRHGAISFDHPRPRWRRIV